MFFGASIFRGATALALAAILLAFTPVSADAKPRKPRFGWQHFTGLVKGGYSVSAATGAAAGPSILRFRAAKDGRSARVSWRNTFYTSGGSYVINMQWTFAANGTVTTSSFDPRLRSFVGTGTFVLNGNHPIQFTVKDATGLVSGTGQFRLIGGGAVAANMTITGLPEGDIACSFTGGRIR